MALARNARLRPKMLQRFAIFYGLPSKVSAESRVHGAALASRVGSESEPELFFLFCFFCRFGRRLWERHSRGTFYFNLI